MKMKRKDLTAIKALLILMANWRTMENRVVKENDYLSWNKLLPKMTLKRWNKAVSCSQTSVAVRIRQMERFTPEIARLQEKLTLFCKIIDACIDRTVF